MYKNFTLSEFVKSDTAKKKGIDNTPPMEAIAHIGELVGAILQPLREVWGKPIIVTSGYRCQKLNQAVGGANTSGHLMGYAADLQPDNMNDFNSFVDFTISWLKGTGTKFDQCILESSNGTKWLHISIRNTHGEQRMQFFSMTV